MKKYLGIITIAAIAAVTGWNYNQSQNEMELSDLALANVEALANNENSSKIKCCPDPGDQCTLSSGDILGDQDEYPIDRTCP